MKITRAELLALLRGAAQDDDPIPALIAAASAVAGWLRDPQVKRAFRKVIKNARNTLE